MSWGLLSSWVRCCVARARPRRNAHVLFLGPAEAGKTALLRRARMQEVTKDAEAAGAEVVRFAMPDMDITAWDVSLPGESREFRRRCYGKAEAVVFVVDSTTPGQLWEARDMLWEILAQSELRECSLLLLANKQDVAGATSLEEVGRTLKLHQIRGRRWVLQATSASEGFGVRESLDWLQDELSSGPPAPAPLVPARAARPSRVERCESDLARGAPDAARKLGRGTRCRRASSLAAGSHDPRLLCQVERPTKLSCRNKL